MEEAVTSAMKILEREEFIRLGFRLSFPRKVVHVQWEGVKGNTVSAEGTVHTQSPALQGARDGQGLLGSMNVAESQ